MNPSWSGLQVFPYLNTLDFANDPCRDLLKQTFTHLVSVGACLFLLIVLRDTQNYVRAVMGLNYVGQHNREQIMLELLVGQDIVGSNGTK